MKVERLMTKDVKTCGLEQSLAEAASLMWEGDCGCIPVVDAEGRAIGIITDRDICMAACFEGKTLRELSIGEAMAKQLLSCHPEDTIQHAESIMRRAQVRRIPVVDAEGRIAGILSLNDVAREAEREKAARAPAVPLDDVALTLSAVCRQRGPQAVAASAE
ncbi:MAG: CBS domain-containing protein [Labilithrix sp.]|nr:CBS domain-containing protein [Labilithrix sp.]MCW5815975.1 CBS domain-containing protein [Labilithrix sp.]